MATYERSVTESSKKGENCCQIVAVFSSEAETLKIVYVEREETQYAVAFQVLKMEF